MLSQIHIEDIVKAALKEDLGHGFDITSQSTIPSNVTATATIRARQEGVLSGLMLGLSAFSLLDSGFDMEVYAYDGEVIEAGQDIAKITGPAAALMTGERTALNFMTHMSGIATQTAYFVQAVDGTNAKICDTRKTLPGLRLIQKYAVKCGGGHNHRMGLDDAILIKDNHIAIAGGIDAALNAAQINASHTTSIEIEVDTLDQLDEVLAHGGADIVMLDNFANSDLIGAIKRINGALKTEASGGVNLLTVADIAATGVDYISVGALTHSAPALDLGLDIDLNN